MFCSKCGKENPDNSKFCYHCGATLNPAQAGFDGGQNQAFHGNPNNYNAGAPAGYMSFTKTCIYNAERQGIGMNWFKFIIYFQLFASALLTFFTGMLTITGEHYGGYADMVYSTFGSGLQIVDIIYGLCSFVIVGVALLARQNLAKFRAKGISQYFVVMGGAVVLGILYYIVVSIITKIAFFDLMIPSSIASLATSVLMLCLNVAYFNNRRQLFVY